MFALAKDHCVLYKHACRSIHAFIHSLIHSFTKYMYTAMYQARGCWCWGSSREKGELLPSWSFHVYVCNRRIHMDMYMDINMSMPLGRTGLEQNSLVQAVVVFVPEEADALVFSPLQILSTLVKGTQRPVTCKIRILPSVKILHLKVHFLWGC